MPRGYHPIAQVDGVKPKRHFRHSPLLAGTTVEVDGHRWKGVRVEGERRARRRSSREAAVPTHL